VAVGASIVPPDATATGLAPDSVLTFKDPGVGGFMSPNVTYIGTIPTDMPGVGGRMLKVGDQMRFYVTGGSGLTIYDVTEPELPIPLGTLAFPHWQNEDVDVSDDGGRVIISADGQYQGATVMPRNVGINVIDASDPSDPVVVASLADSNHTVTCADPACEWLYGSSGKIYRVTSGPAIVDTGQRWKPTNGAAHALNRDDAGLLVSDSTPRFVLDPRVDPLHPQVVAEGTRDNSKDNSLQHNNVRPEADGWVARDPEDPDYENPTMRPGELLIGNSETNFNNQCSDLPGGLSTWSMVNFDQDQDLTQLDTFLPTNGDEVSGDPPFNLAGCSGHWFTERDYLVTAAWFEHGIRFFDIDPGNGDITQRGFFQPVWTAASAAHWVSDAEGAEYVYSVDYVRGIDILRFDRDADVPSNADFARSWDNSAVTPVPSAALERFSCSLAAGRG
jgi:hypothetical protein